MVNRPSNEEQVRLVMRNLRAEYFEKLEFTGVASFEQMDRICMAVEDRIRREMIKGEALMAKSSVPEANTLTHQVSIQSGSLGTPRSQSWRNFGPVKMKKTRPSQNPPPGRRFFDELGIPLTAALEKLVKEGYLQRLDPRPMPDPIPSHWDTNQLCAFHQSPAHDTCQCLKLRHTIQNLIDDKVLTVPSLSRKRYERGF